MNFTLEEERPEPNRFEPCFSTDDPGLLNIMKAFLEANGVEYIISGEELLFLTGGAIPLFSEPATIYIQKSDMEIFDRILENQFSVEL
ncbi:MAG: hypothetical protein KDK36_16060 [Leptospiraceae bacterium]|nr:hypothetical protein [Leptospiraceae bacterium]